MRVSSEPLVPEKGEKQVDEEKREEKRRNNEEIVGISYDGSVFWPIT